jgi:ribosomal protein L19
MISFIGVFMKKKSQWIYESLMTDRKLSEGSSCDYLFSFATLMVKKMKVKVKNQLDATKYAVLLSQTSHILRAVFTPTSPALHNPGGFLGMFT